MASFNDALKKRLSPELYAQVSDSLGDDFNYDLVPRARLNTVIAQRNKLQEQLGVSSPAQDEFTMQSPLSQQVPDALMAQFQQTSHQTGAAVPDNRVNPGAGGAKPDPVAELERQHKEALREVSLRYEVLNKLRAAGAIDPELIYTAKLVDLTKVTDAEGGGFTGLDEAVKTLTDNKERAYLFGAGSGTVPAGTGKAGMDEKTAQVTAIEKSLDQVFAAVSPGIPVPASAAATLASAATAQTAGAPLGTPST